MTTMNNIPNAERVCEFIRGWHIKSNNEKKNELLMCDE